MPAIAYYLKDCAKYLNFAVVVFTLGWENVLAELLGTAKQITIKIKVDQLNNITEFLLHTHWLYTEVLIIQGKFYKLLNLISLEDIY